MNVTSATQPLREALIASSDIQQHLPAAHATVHVTSDTTIPVIQAVNAALQRLNIMWTEDGDKERNGAAHISKQ